MKALIVYGGWDGHEPDKVAKIFEKALTAKGARVELSETLDVLLDAGKLAGLDVIVPHWTMGTMTTDQWKGLNDAVRSGVGVAGVHGGAGDAFRDNLEYQWMIGGQFVGHPHVGEYEVRLTPHPSPITEHLPQSFRYNSEQYYQLVDPGVAVLADTLYEYDGRRTIMPSIWVKSWGKGRVFYSALGHVAKEFADYPHVLEMTVRGILWAGEGKK
jgi:uncharacterized protein